MLIVVENLFLNCLLWCFGIIDCVWLCDDVCVVMVQVGFDVVDFDMLVGVFGIGYQQMVEIVCNLIGDCCVLIFDELIVMLIVCEVELLFEQIDWLKVCGVVIVYILYWFEEFVCVVECVVVLCDGWFVYVGDMVVMMFDGFVMLMVGCEIGEYIDFGECCFGVLWFVVLGFMCGMVVCDVLFEVCVGEIFGILGLIGVGCIELL